MRYVRLLVDQREPLTPESPWTVSCAMDVPAADAGLAGVVVTNAVGAQMAFAVPAGAVHVVGSATSGATGREVSTQLEGVA
jgi:hypothetical protein